MTVLHQIIERRGVVRRVKPGETPVVELHLEPGQYIASFKITESFLGHSERVTTDWHWTAAVVTPLP